MVTKSRDLCTGILFFCHWMLKDYLTKGTEKSRLLQLDGGTGINRYFINRQWQRWPTQTENKSSENWMSHKSTKCVWCRPRPTLTMNCISLYRPSTAQYENEQMYRRFGVLTKERKLTLSALGPRTYIIKTEQTDRLVNHCFAVFAVDTASVNWWSTTAGYWSVAYKSTVGYWKLKKAERLSGAMPMPVDIIFFTAITGWPYLAAPGVSVCCQRIALLYSGKFNKSNALNRTEMALK